MAYKGPPPLCGDGWAGRCSVVSRWGSPLLSHSCPRIWSVAAARGRRPRHTGGVVVGMNIFCYCQQAEGGDGGPEREVPPQNASFKTSQFRQMFLMCKVSRWASVSQTQYISNLQKRKVKVRVMRKENAWFPHLATIGTIELDCS